MAEVNAHNADATEAEDMGIGYTKYLKIHAMLNCALMPTTAEYNNNKDRAWFGAAFKAKFNATPMARVYHNANRDKDNKGYHPVGLTIAEATPYARKFEVLGLAGLHYIAVHGTEPPWLGHAYFSKFGVPPP